MEEEAKDMYARDQVKVLRTELTKKGYLKNYNSVDEFVSKHTLGVV